MNITTLHKRLEVITKANVGDEFWKSTYASTDSKIMNT
jgi:hypothetical protein